MVGDARAGKHGGGRKRWQGWRKIYKLASIGTNNINQVNKKRVREKSRECHNHKPQPFPDTKRKRKQTKPNKRKSNKCT